MLLLGQELIIFPSFFNFPAYPCSLAIEILLQGVNEGFGLRDHDPAAPRSCLGRMLYRGQADPKVQMLQEKLELHSRTP